MSDLLNSTRLWLARSPLTRFRLSGPTPDKVAPLPEDPWFPAIAPDPDFAEDFYFGRIRLAGHLVETANSPFDPPQDGIEAHADWTDALHGFGWLRNLRDEGTPLARANAQAFVTDWIERFGTDLDHQAWKPRIAARRLEAWLTHYAMLERETNPGLNRVFLRSIGQHVRALRIMAPATSGLERAEIGLALCLASEALGRNARGRAHLEEGLREGLAPDGGPLSRNPRDAVRWLHGLNCLLSLRKGNRSKDPESQGLADGLANWLRPLLHADGRLAQFNGTGWIDPETIRTALAGRIAAERPAAPASGYGRLEGSNGSVLIADIADGIAPFESAGAFEFSVPEGRLIVSCGVPERDGPLRDALASAAAHSTLSAETDNPISSVEGEVRADKLRIVTRRADAEQPSFEHVRWLRLDGDGLSGIDRVNGSQPAGLRFHLHDDVVATAESDHAIRLEIEGPNGTRARWTLQCIDAPLRLEDTMLFAETTFQWSRGQGQPSRQIVVDMPGGTEGEIPGKEGEGTRELRWMLVPSGK